MTKKSKILIITCTMLVLLFIIEIIICVNIRKQPKTSNNNNLDETQNIINNEQKSEGYINLENSTQIFSTKDTTVEKKYIVDDNKYHIIIDKDSNKITVNNKDIYYSEETIISVYIIKDILAVETSINCNGKLVLLEMNGNILRTISNIMPYYSNIGGMNITYSVDSYEPNGNEIYKSHYKDTYSLTYLGNNNFSETTKVEDQYKTVIYTPSCALPNDKYTIYNNNGLEIKVGEDHEPSEQGYYLVKKKLYVNGTAIDIAYNLGSITLLPDNYILVRSYYQDGFSEFLNILDFNGNIINDFKEKIENGFFVSHPLSKDITEIYSNGTFNIYVMSAEATEKMGRYLENSDSYPSDYVIGKLYKFNYLGNGKIDDGYIERNITIEDFNNEYVK